MTLCEIGSCDDDDGDIGLDAEGCYIFLAGWLSVMTFNGSRQHNRI